ncbi:hypothetical protein GCM10010123_02100 [Pilimelia anulata]|uniref:DUF5983 domain-containing protein n=1 Tax=Pilimelia anulata TaxID=53371 RepID=A0A8J3B1A7_9ACTN|nr:hypothetical protein [Pilimelia anulata]GGJ75685.1 hypothetical protein GCM10010123_02100 [Pilimelia anulata]
MSTPDPAASEDGPRIIRMLDASTEHLPPPLRHPTTGLTAVTGVVADAREYGFLLWVPADPDAYATDYPGVRADVLALQRYARELGCDYVLLDSDAEPVPGLAVYPEPLMQP